ncbi:IS481 family transposase [Rhabdochromatium marinum]|uniref:IS481 family transposase n=1 Tax=Rhabdochromatium marinum TaxID=48729 RepID=UPI0019051BE3|nr:IS481 family transposase [Rhabdochromatium marinum]MBK1650330.1 IS481 family transposase [Rhabdochromatium marinum]
MQVQLHKNARTTPAVRAELQASTLPNSALARQYGISEPTVAKWRGRESTADASHRPKRLQTNLTPAQEAIVVELRKTLLLPLDDLLAVSREFISEAVSRSGLDRCLRRHGVSNLKALMPAEERPKDTEKKTFKDYEPGFVHVDIKYLPQMPDEASRQYLFVAIDRATRWVYVEILPTKSAKHAQAFLKHLIANAPFHITKVLTDNGKEFSDRFCATGQREPTGQHAFDKVCRRHGIDHRLTKPRRPQTNGMVERFNGRIAEVLQTTRFRSGEQLSETLHRYVRLYNQHIPQRALGHVAPIQALKQWYEKQPDLFVKRPNNLPGLDS